MSSSFDGSIDKLPAELEGDEYWSNARNEILNSLRRDAQGLPMTTSQNLIMERMATFYAITRKRETDPEFKLSPSDLRQNNQQWLAMTSEFNKQITIGEDKRRHAMIETIMKIINDSLLEIDDDKTREDVRKRLSEGFRNAGL